MSNKFRTPSGFPEYLPSEQKQFNALRDVFTSVAESFAFTPLETPAVEYMDTLASKGDINKEIYTIGRAMSEGEDNKESKEESQRGLRFDLTVPTARYVAQNYNDLVFPFKRYQVQPVWRGERPQKGRFRQFYQADLDIIANENLAPEYDAEIIMAMATALSQMNFGAVTFQINNRKFLEGMVEQYGSNDIEKSIQIIDKIQKIDQTEAVNLLEETGMGNIDDLLEKLASVSVDQLDSYFEIETENEKTREGMREIKELFNNLEQLGVFGLENVSVVFNPAIARGLDYYTGTIVETTIDGYEQYGSICSGGRYADLAGRFINRNLPGVGMSIGLSRLFDVLTTEGLVPENNDTGAVLVGILDEQQKELTLATAGLLRAQGIAVEVFYDSRKDFPKQQKIAQRKGSTFVICEEDGTFTVISDNKKTKAVDFDSLINLLK